MIYPRISHSILAFCCLAALCMAQYIWPVGPCSYHPQPQVAQTYGDFEKGELPGQIYFHSGVDIPSRGGTEIYALEGGFVKRDYGVGGFGICIYLIDNNGRTWRYHHLTNLQFNPDGENVTKGQLLAYTAHKPDGWIGGYDDHLHLGVINVIGNPIDNPLLYLPYSDPGNKSPFVWFPEIFIYNRAAVKNIYGKLWWLYPTYAGQPTPKIYDYVDIIAKAQDDMDGTLANGNKVYTGVFESGFWITDKNDNSVLGPLFLHQFSGSLPDAGQFDAYFSQENPSSNWHDFFYIVTNLEGDATRCWATKARSGGTSENDLRARINFEALFPDKEYKIWLINRDAANHISQDVAYVCLDNFRPYVTMVQIGQEEKVVKYESHWPDVPANDYDLGELIIDVDDYCRVGKLLTFLIEFSEDMQTDALPTLQVQFPNGTIKTVPSGEWIGSNVYRAVTGDNFIPSGTSGKATLMISGALDLAGNQNDGNPRTIAYRDAGGDWCQAEAPPDDNYKFWIEPPPQVIFTDPADGEEDVDIYDFRKKKQKDIGDEFNFQVSFNKPMDTGQDISVSEYQVIRDNMQYHFIRRNHSIVSLAVSLRSLEC